MRLQLNWIECQTTNLEVFLPELVFIQVVVVTALGQKLFVGAAFDDPPLAYDQNTISVANGGEPVGYHQAGAVPEDRGDGLLNELLRLRVDGAGGFVQHEDAGIGQDHPGEADELLLAGGQADAPFAHLGVVALGLLQDELLGVDQPGGPLHLLQGGVGATVADIIRDGAGEQVGGLEYVPKAALEPQLGPGPIVLAVDVDGA